MLTQDISVLNAPIDASNEFTRNDSVYFNSTRLAMVDAQGLSGEIEWKRYGRKLRTSFNQVHFPFEQTIAWEFPPDYGEDKFTPFDVSFVSPRTIRIRIAVGSRPLEQPQNESSLMLQHVGTDGSWETVKDERSTVCRSDHGTFVLHHDPVQFQLLNSRGELLTESLHIHNTRSLLNCAPIPFSFVRRASDLKRFVAATFSLAPDEGIYGCGESFTRLNKRGQKLVLWTTDPKGVQTRELYKPVPFFISSRGYGMFVHTSAPLTLDLGHSYDGASTMYLCDDVLDLFVFLGTPKEVLSEYTALTGRSPLPPLWSFGLWMGRNSYRSEAEVREVAQHLRDDRIPCDVIHLDTGWFEEDWRCNYEFSRSRFDDPKRMVEDLRKMGYELSLWQIPYFTPNNSLYKEAVEKGYAVLDADGGLPTEDAIVDFSNPEAVRWYQGLLRRLLDLGVAAIKADFGEAAPLHGVYASGKSGLYEHNLYPIRYCKAIFDVVAEATGEGILWGRSAWAGGQRYPVHWGGDAESTNTAMAASLRAGLSLGLCGFSFWSHDIGGYVGRPTDELHRRWLAFGVLSSHCRCHGASSREPWEYGPGFVDEFRSAVELRYRLMPYIYAQSKDCSAQGFPMLRTLFFEYPDDPTSWFIEDQYFFGSDILVAPLFKAGEPVRNVYLPPGYWIDYLTHRLYEGGRWHTVRAGRVPIVMMVRNGAAIPEVPVAQSTKGIDWSQVTLNAFCYGEPVARGLVCVPGQRLQKLQIDLSDTASKRGAPGDESALPSGWKVRKVEVI